MNIMNLHDPKHVSDNLAEAERLMTVCNSCRYCEGLCAVFPAMELRRVFPDGDLNYLANLCHSCGACFDDCQFSPPHEFNVNVPATLAKVRNDSYKSYVWPPQFAGVFERNGLAISLACAASVSLFILGFALWHDANILFGTHEGPGSFYRLMPHNAMALLFGGAFGYAVIAIAMSLRSFWKDISPVAPVSLQKSIWQAVKDASTLKYLDGGGVGCSDGEHKVKDRRRLFHHFTSYGFLLCFAATSIATLYHYLLSMEAPYPWYDLPVVLGTLGGAGLIVGPLGLLWEKQKRRSVLSDLSNRGMDLAFIYMLLLTSATGLLLLFFRSTPAMGLLLSIHLGVVFSLFITMPYGKFVHGLFRFLALVRHAQEQHPVG